MAKKKTSLPLVSPLLQGVFEVSWEPSQATFVPSLLELLTQVEKVYQEVGLPLQPYLKIEVVEHLNDWYEVPEGWVAMYNGMFGGAEVLIEPRDPIAPFFLTLLHEIAHYVHDQQIVGGKENATIRAGYQKAQTEWLKHRPKKKEPWGTLDLQNPKLRPMGTWAVTHYALHDEREFFAELVTVGLFNPSFLKPVVWDWLHRLFQSEVKPWLDPKVRGQRRMQALLAFSR